MTAIYIAAGALVLTGLVSALALISIRYLTHFPASLDPAGTDWPLIGVDELWWDEGILWAAR